jgi:pyrimidine-specific ribonucleoside hydrolase
VPTPLIIDTDPGVDDAVALMLALHSPEVELVAVTASFGNIAVEGTARNARRLMALAGRSDVPVAVGAARPLVHHSPGWAAEWHGADGLGGRGDGFPEPPPGDSRTALALTAEILRSADEPVTIASIGPLTNTALLLAAHPELTDRIGRIVVMGGGLSGGNFTAAAEFNVIADPEAAQRVFTQAEVPVTMVPLDLTMRVLADTAWLATLEAAGPRSAQLRGVLELYREAFRERYDVDAVAIHDAVAVLEAIVPGTLGTTPMPVQVACDFGPARGATVPDRRRGAEGPRVHVALDADVDAVLAEILERVSRLG